MPEIDKVMEFATKYQAEEELFLIFGDVIRRQPLSISFVTEWIERYPSLTFALLRAYPPDVEFRLHTELETLTNPIARNIIRSANETRIATLVALEKIAKSIGELTTAHYIDLLISTALSMRSKILFRRSFWS